MKIKLAVLVLGVFLAVMPSCLSATQVSVKITTDMACPGLRSHLTVGLPTTIDTTMAQSTSLPDGCKSEGNPNYIGTTVIARGSSDIVTVRVAAAEPGNDPSLCPLRGKVGCVVAQRTIKFVSHSSLTLPIHLDAACKNTVCKEGEICKSGGCVPVDNTPTPCDPVTGLCEEPPIDAGPDAPRHPFYVYGVAAGGNAACAILHDAAAPTGEHQLVCWGTNTALTGTKPARVMLGGTKVEDAAIGDNHICTRESTGRVECFGASLLQQCGVRNCSKPVEVTPGAAKTISAGGDHTCYLTDTGELYCWGSNAFGEISSNFSKDLPLTKVNVPTPVDLIAVGPEHMCAFGFQKVACWGNNSDSRCGAQASPTMGLGGPGIVQRNGAGVNVEPTGVAASLAVGRTHGAAVAMTPYATVWAWGNNDMGQVNGTAKTPATTSLAVTLAVGSNSTPVSLALGKSHSCSLNKGGVYCWGDPTVTRCPKDTGCDIGLPAGTVIDLASGDNHVCALVDETTSGGGAPIYNVYCWGAADLGQVGSTSTSNVGPTKVDLSSFQLQ